MSETEAAPTLPSDTSEDQQPPTEIINDEQQAEQVQEAEEDASHLEMEEGDEMNTADVSDDLLNDVTKVEEAELRLEEAELRLEEEAEAGEEVAPEISLDEGEDITYEDEEAMEGDKNGEESNVTEEVAKEGGKDDNAEEGTKEDAEEEEEEEEEDAEEEGETSEKKRQQSSDPNVMPQVNVAVLSKRKWRVKVYPLKPNDFMSGQIAKVFKFAKESLLYIMSPVKHARGKGEMYISSVSQAVHVVQNLMKLDFEYPEINIEVVKKSDEGVIEEKAYMRFDTKMVRMLCVPFLQARRMGSKRERVIGSVFVKNLPVGTTKDMLRVMFPFANEINYNPEKFKDCTARLVLNNRNSVIPCLKAFAKIELGGNILELHPLEKRKKSVDDEKRSGSQRRSESDSGKKDESKKDSKRESQSRSEHKDEKSASKSTDGKDEKSSPLKKETPKKGPGASNLSDAKKNESKIQDIKNKVRNKMAQRRKAGLVGGQERRKIAGKPDSSKSAFTPSGGYKQGQGKFTGARDFGNRQNRNDRSPRSQQDRVRGGRGGAAGGGARNRNRFGSAGGFGRSGNSGRNFDDRRRFAGGSMSQGSGEMGLTVDKTKDMMVLQSQLSMAIKSQLAMLNQTQLAVEQAKRGARGMGLGAEASTSAGQLAGASGLGRNLGGKRGGRGDQYGMRREQRRDRDFNRNRSRSRDGGANMDSLGMLGAGGYNKRTAATAGFDDSYGEEAAYSKRRDAYGSQPMSLWPEEPAADLYDRPSFGYAAQDRAMDERAASFGSSSARNMSSFGYSDSSYGYRY